MVVKEAVEGLYSILYRGRSCIGGKDKRIRETGAFLTCLSNSSTMLSS